MALLAFFPRLGRLVSGRRVFFDAYIALIPKTDGDPTPLGQRLLSVLPVVYRIWASARNEQLEGWFQSWVPDSVVSAGGDRSSVEAWYTTALDIEEVLSGVVDSDILLFVGDVIMSFDTVDRSILDMVLSSLGLPAWFQHAYFQYHSHVGLRLRLAAGLGRSWTRDGGIPQGCPLSMMFTVAFFLPRCRFLAAQEEVEPQLYCMLTISSVCPGIQVCLCALLDSPPVMLGWLVKNLPSSECVLMSTSRTLRNDMRCWIVTDEGDQWSVKLDVQDLGGLLFGVGRLLWLRGCGWSWPA